MVIAILGESCVGKSTIAKKLASSLNAEVFSGQGLSQSGQNALLFKKKLAGPSGNILYIVSEKEQLALLPENCLRILVTAEPETIRKRFAQRMHGQLPAPAAAMLERRPGQFDSEPHALHINTDVQSTDEACALILARIG